MCLHLLGKTHNASFDISCADFAEFTTSQVEWALLIDSANHNYLKLFDLLQRLEGLRYYLNSRTYADNVYYFRAVAQQSFILGSSCFESYCASTSDLLHALSMETGQVPDHELGPFTRLNPEIQH